MTEFPRIISNDRLSDRLDRGSFGNRLILNFGFELEKRGEHQVGCKSDCGFITSHCLFDLLTGSKNLHVCKIFLIAVRR